MKYAQQQHILEGTIADEWCQHYANLTCRE